MNTMIKSRYLMKTVTSAPVGGRPWRCISALYGKRTLLLDAQQVHESRLVFCYFPPGVQSCFCHFFEAQTAGRKTLYFVANAGGAA